MLRYITHSFFLIIFSVSFYAQEGVKPLTTNINYLYGDLKVVSNKQNNLNSTYKAASLILPFKEDFFYSSTQSYPSQLLWSDSSTYVNSGFAIAPLSIGVATFDGLNKRGYPYTPNLVNMASSLPADTLTSKPINLAFSPGDSIALTFYYQARGNGDPPELTDTFIVDYFKPKQNKWEKIWFQKGNSSPNTNDTVFKRGFLRVIDTSYLHDGFKFRFRNKATTAGNFDHWNLDYVYLDKNRNFLADTNYNDYAFGYIPTTLLKKYNTMPWKHYDTSDMADKNSVFIRNNGILNGNLTYTNNFYDNNNIKVHGYFGGAVPSVGVFKYNGWLNFAPISNPTYTYNFPLMTAPAAYKVQHILYTTSTDFTQGNDTVIQEQKFSNYFAFDDGSAEEGYFVLGQGGKMAGKYTLRVSDTLRSVRIYFDPSGSLTTNQGYNFRINVWQAGANGPSNIVLYRDSTKNPAYYPNGNFNTFSEYQLTTPKVLSPGTYYIGIQQQVSTGIVVGFDRNQNHSSDLYYDSGNGWTQSSIYGSIMIRPVFGQQAFVGVTENTVQQKTALFSVYPNPASDQFTIKSNDVSKATYIIINSIGQKVSEGKIEDPLQTIYTENLSSGMYFLILKINERLVQQHKIIIQH